MAKFHRGNITRAVLTPEEVLRIRDDYASGEWSQGALARRHQVGVGTIGRIVRGESWQQYRQPLSQSDIEHDAAMASIAPLSPEAEADMRASEKRWLDRIAAEAEDGKAEDGKKENK